MSPYLRAQFFDDRIVVEQFQAVVDLDLDAVLADVDRVEIVPFRLPFQDDGGIADPRQHLGGLAAGVRFLDRAGQRALAADGQPAGHGAGTAAEHPRRDHQFVLRAERMTEGIDLFADHQRGRRPPTQTGIVADRFGSDFRAALGAHVDSDNLVHSCFSFTVKKVKHSPFHQGGSTVSGVTRWPFALGPIL